MGVANLIDVYAKRVVNGALPAGTYHRLSCARHLRDRAREDTDAFPYRFDLTSAQRFFRFANLLRHYKGEWAGRPILLEPHQQFRLGSIFGWRQTATGYRRFKTAYNELPRKQGKSLEAAIIAIYTTFFDDEPGAEGYTIATKRDQAKIVFDNAKELVQRSGLRSRIATLKHNLSRAAMSQKLEPLGADADSTDGLNPHLIIVDELHKYKNRDLLDVMETATGSRRQALNYQITTAGTNLFSPCGDQHDYSCKILDQVLVDETFFAFIAHAEPDDDPFLESTWRKANPNYGVSVRPDELRALATKAINMPAAANAFKQMRLNLWVDALTPWLSLEGWKKGQSPAWERFPAVLEGEACYIGIDLSSKIDLTACVLLFPPTETCVRWRLLVWCLTPEATLAAREKRDRAPYLQWVKEGYLRTNPGNRIDQHLMQTWVTEAAAHYTIQQIGIDPWNAGALVSDLMTEGYDVVEISQSYAQLSAPAKEFEADVLDGLVDAGGHPLMQWCVSNAVVKRDDKDNIFPVKNKSRGRIDPVVAAVLARKLATTPPEDAEDPELVVA
jgi:phage terminase large subunit-like protein